MAIKDGWKGRYLEDFEVGDVYRHAFGRTITEADNIWFTLLTMNTNQLHFNEHYAKQSEWGKYLRRVHPSEVRFPKGAGGIRADSLALCHQIRTIARSRLGRRIGAVDDQLMATVGAALRLHLAV